MPTQEEDQVFGLNGTILENVVMTSLLVPALYWLTIPKLKKIKAEDFGAIVKTWTQLNAEDSCLDYQKKEDSGLNRPTTFINSYQCFLGKCFIVNATPYHIMNSEPRPQ